MATCANCGRERGEVGVTYSAAVPLCLAHFPSTSPEIHQLDCERAAHARTRAELAAARAVSPPSLGLVDSRLTELARTDATVAATLKHHANGVPLVEALTACVLAIAEHNRAMYKLAIDVVMTQPPASIVIHGAPGLVEAARNLVAAFDVRPNTASVLALYRYVEALRAALPKEPTND
jgi:hypothetical protein